MTSADVVLAAFERTFDHCQMPPLGSRERSRLPNSAFAYIDSQGRRSLPIHDEAHVRNALARFGRVSFEDEEARDRARMRLLKAAKKLGIMPLGFLGGQLRPEQKLPRGQVTFLLTDIEGSTQLVDRLGDGYAPVLSQLRRLQRSALRRAGGREVDARGDELLAAFDRARSALDAAVAIQRGVGRHGWPEATDPRLRIAVHTGRPTLTASGYVGLSVHTVARLCASTHGGQIVLSSAAHEALGQALLDGIGFKTLGAWRFQGLREAVELLQVLADDLPDEFPSPRPSALAAVP